MSSWRSRILGEFTPGVAPVTLVADPDGLLLEEGVLTDIHERGFEIVPFEDPIAFRYAYEYGIRARRDRGERVDAVVVLRSPQADFEVLPHDVLQTGRRLSFSIGDLFPNLSRSVLATLEPRDLDALYDAEQRHRSDLRGDNATKEFVLRHVFGIVPELVVKPSDLLTVLLRRHCAARRVPPSLDEHFIELIRRTGKVSGLAARRDRPGPGRIPRIPAGALARVPRPLGTIRVGRKRGPRALRTHLARARRPAVRARGCPRLRGRPVPGKTAQAGSSREGRLAVGDLGRRRSPHGRDGETNCAAWIVCSRPQTRRYRSTMTGMTGGFISPQLWAELGALTLALNSEVPDDERRKIETLRSRVDTAFAEWIEKRYRGLVNLPPVPPVMLHHLPRLLARDVHDSPRNKVALLVVDGLALDQWIVVRRELTKQRPDYRFHEGAVFAWIPTLTSVSRQATFAGRAPLYFPESIHSTDREPALWRRFWADEGIAHAQVLYARSLGSGIPDDVAESIASPAVRVAGLVVDTVDKIMHGMPLGTAGMHELVRLWAGKPHLATLLDLLLERGFRVYLTSDHGNIEAAGCGRPSEGAVADLRGERVRVYRDASLRRSVRDKFPAARDWAPVGLPEDYLPLLAPDRSAFVQAGQRIVGHGGACIEELIVPLVRIERREP